MQATTSENGRGDSGSRVVGARSGARSFAGWHSGAAAARSRGRGGRGHGQLRVLPQRVERRRQIFKLYQQALGRAPGITFMPEANWGRATRWLTVIQVDPAEFGATRKDIRLHLESFNIEARPVWKPMHLQRVFEGCRVAGGSVAADLFDRGLCLPSGSQMTDADCQRVVDALLSTPRKGRGVS